MAQKKTGIVCPLLICQANGLFVKVKKLMEEFEISTEAEDINEGGSSGRQKKPLCILLLQNLSKSKSKTQQMYIYVYIYYILKQHNNITKHLASSRCTHKNILVKSHQKRTKA